MTSMDIAETTPLTTTKSILETREVSGQNAHILSGNFQHHLDPSHIVESEQPSGGVNFFLSLSKKQKYLLVLCTFTNILEGCGFSLLAPFFPQEAARKGMSEILTGFVFSMFELIIFVTSPIFGAYLTTLGPKFVFISGAFVGGVCIILFGTLDKCPSGTPFIVMTMLCRSIGAIGFSGILNTLMAMLSSEFPKNASSCLALLETAWGVGMMVGPAIGGGLYELGGFGLPFYVIGGLVLLNGAMVAAILPNQEHLPRDKKGSQFSLLKNPMVFLPMMSIASGSIGIAFLEPTLANHLGYFGLSVAMIALFFMIVPCSYTMFTPVWGIISDKTTKYKHLIVIGHLIFGLGFLIIGPSELLPFVPLELWTVVIGLLLIGTTFGCCVIPPMKCMVIGAKESGFEDNIDTYAIIAGLVNSMFSLGSFFGPTFGGILVQEFGFPMSVTVIGVWSIIMCVLTLTYFVARHLRSKQSYTNLSNSKTGDAMEGSSFVVD